MTRRAAFGIQVWSLNQARKKIGGKGTISGKWHPQPALLPTKWVIRANRDEGDIVYCVYTVYTVCTILCSIYVEPTLY